MLQIVEALLNSYYISNTQKYAHYSQGIFFISISILFMAKLCTTKNYCDLLKSYRIFLTSKKRQNLSVLEEGDQWAVSLLL